MKIILYSFIVLSIYWILRISISFFWIKKSKKCLNEIKEGTIHSFILVIPVFEERDIILGSIDYFLNLIKPFPASKLLIVTTDKEEKTHEERKRMAKELVDKGTRNKIISLIKDDFGEDLINFSNIRLLRDRANEIINASENTINVLKRVHNKNVIIVNYPFVDGKMAHQLNFCLKLLIKNGIWNNELLGVYNADSRPDKETLFWLSKKNIGLASVFQQYGNYFGNIESIIKRGFICRSILFSSSIWQNRWSIGFEIFNNLKQFIFRKNSLEEKFLYPLNYCIGHGLFFTRDIFEKCNFSENTHNEDAIFGLQLSYERIKILPLPLFDLSDSPTSIRSLFFQKASWFFGPFQAPLYYKKLKNEIDNVDNFKLYLLSGKLFFHAVFWLIGPSFLLFLLLNALITLNFALFLACYLIFLVIPNFLIFILFPNKKIKTGEALILILFGSFFTYMIHGASAYYSIFMTIQSIFTKREIDKYKTKILRD